MSRASTATAALALVAMSCAANGRFALRPIVTRDTDDVPFATPPAKDEVPSVANGIDTVALRPLVGALAAERSKPARDVNALDEVPDSTWFTNRDPTAEDVTRGPCSSDGPVAPFVVTSSKVGGVTPGFEARDARGRRYVFKLDELARYGQPEISTAADAIVSRLYWAVGFNAPCNRVVDVASDDLRFDPKAVQHTDTGRRTPLDRARFAESLRHATRTPSGKMRMSASLFIEGTSLGPWRVEGTRADDPNDAIPHEDRRELRAERFLAAWVAHWDSRRANAYDAFVRARGGGGYVVHYFLDFSDAVGGTISRTIWPEPRSGYESLLSLPTIGEDAAGFGFVRRPWDDVKVDPRFPDLGFLDVAHFDPLGFSPQTPLERWERAQPQDLAWMARKLARLGVDHVRAAVREGRLTKPGEEERLVDILMGRRERILRVSFASVSPLADPKLEGGELCMRDLARATGVSSAAATSYGAELHFGEGLDLGPRPRVRPTQDGLCVEMPHHFAPPGSSDDSAERYAIVDVIRAEGRTRTRLRAHFYDLDRRGFVLVGLARE